MTNYGSNDVMAGVLASPPRQSPVGLTRGRVRVQHGTFQIPAGLLINEYIILFRLPTVARILTLFTQWDDLGGTMTLQLGLYDAHENISDSPTVRDFDLFDVAGAGSAAVASVDQRFATLNHNTTGQMLWELLGLTADPGGDYDVVVTFTAATTPITGADYSWRCTYIVD